MKHAAALTLALLAVTSAAQADCSGTGCGSPHYHGLTLDGPVTYTNAAPAFAAFALTTGQPTTNSIPLSCTPPTGALSATPYQFYQQTAGAAGRSPIATPQAACSITATGLPSGVQVSFTVDATGANGLVSTSNVASQSTLPTAPGAFAPTASGITATGAVLTWAQPPGSQPIVYQPQIMGPGATVFANYGAPTSALSVTITGLTAATAYTAQVTATNAANAPAASAPVQFTTSAQPGGGCSSPVGAIWNCGDQVNVTVSGAGVSANLVAQTNSASASGIRAYPSHTGGAQYWELTLGTVSTAFRAGVANSTWSQTSALGADANGLGWSPNGTVTGATSTAAATWSPSAKAAGVVLSGSNLIAKTADGTGQQAVLGTVGYSGGAHCFEVTLGAPTTQSGWNGDAYFGLGNGTTPLTPSGDPFQTAVGNGALYFYPFFNDGGYINGSQAFFGGGADVTSAVVMVCVNLSISPAKLWFQTTASIAASKPWNWDATGNQNPVGNVGGVSLASLGGGLYYPLFGAFYGYTMTLNSGPSFTYSLPSGYTAWGASASAGAGTYATGDTLRIANNQNSKLIWFADNAGNWNGSASANPATGVGGISYTTPTGALFPALSDAAMNEGATANFGGSTFGYALPAGFLAPNGSGSPTGGTGAQAIRVHDLLAKNCINTHFNFGGSPYQAISAANNLSNLTYVGAVCIRDQGVAFWPAGYIAGLITPSNGMVVDDIVGNNQACTAAVTNAVTDFGLLGAAGPAGANGLISFELYNEFNSSGQNVTCAGGSTQDDGTGAPGLTGGKAVTTASNAIRANGTINALPIVNASLAIGSPTWNIKPYQAAENQAAVLDSETPGATLASYVDFGNWHPYPNPAGTASGPLTDMQAGAVSAGVTAPGKPFYITETGYQTGVNAPFSGATDAAISKMGLNLFLDCALVGATRCVRYELYDDTETFGLFTSSGSSSTPKIQATTMHNLITILADSGGAAATFTPAKLPRTLSVTSGVNEILTQNSSGPFFDVLWNEASVYNAATGLDVTPTPVTELFSLAQAVSRIDWYDPTIGTASQGNCTNCSSLSIQLKGYPIIVKATVP